MTIDFGLKTPDSQIPALRFVQETNASRDNYTPFIFNVGMTALLLCSFYKVWDFQSHEFNLRKQDQQPPAEFIKEMAQTEYNMLSQIVDNLNPLN